MRWFRLIFVLVTFAAIALIAAKMVDFHVAQWVHETKPLNRGGLIAEVLRWPGWFPFAVGIAILVGLIHRRHVWAAAPLILSGLLAGVNWLIKWCVGRTRPVITIAPFQFHPFGGGIYHLFHNAGLSFPSGDATMAFAAATCLAILMPRWAVLFFSDRGGHRSGARPGKCALRQ